MPPIVSSAPQTGITSASAAAPPAAKKPSAKTATTAAPAPKPTPTAIRTTLVLTSSMASSISSRTIDRARSTSSFAAQVTPFVFSSDIERHLT